MKSLNVFGKYYVKQITTKYGIYNADNGINICYYIFKTLKDAKQFIENTNWITVSSTTLGGVSYTKIKPKYLDNHTYIFKNENGLIIAVINIQIFTDNFYIVKNL